MSLLERFALRGKTRQPAKELPSLFTGTILKACETDPITHKEFPTGMPFDVEIANGGRVLRRYGKPFTEEKGIRIFVIDNKSLDTLYERVGRSSHLTPEIFYRFLKMYERKNGSIGRRLALERDGTVEINERMVDNGYTLIVKTVDHPTKEKFRTPDDVRVRITTDKGVEAQVTERVIPWFRDRRLNLTEATKNVAALNIKEPAEQPGLRDFFLVGGYKNGELTRVFEKQDQENGFFMPNHNTLVIKSLREQMGPVAAPPLDVSILKNSEGGLSVRITRKSGVTGVSVNGQTHVLEDGQAYVDVPIISSEKTAAFSLFYDCGRKHQRKALEMRLTQANGQVYADFVSGIEEVPLIPYNPSAGIIAVAQTEQERQAARLREESRKQEEKRRKEAAQEAEIGTNVTLFRYISGQGAGNSEGSGKVQAYEPGDEKKLREMVAGLKARQN